MCFICSRLDLHFFRIFLFGLVSATKESPTSTRVWPTPEDHMAQKNNAHACSLQSHEGGRGIRRDDRYRQTCLQWVSERGLFGTKASGFRVSGLGGLMLGGAGLWDLRFQRFLGLWFSGLCFEAFPPLGHRFLPTRSSKHTSACPRSLAEQACAKSA